GPGPMGQNAKGFTIYAKTPADAMELQAQIDKELTAKGLGLKSAPETGNVDLIEGQSNRVGTVRDFYAVARDGEGNIGAPLDDTLMQRIETKFAGGHKLSDAQLRTVEEETGIAKGSLTYDNKGKLMLKLQSIDKPRNGQIYVDESQADSRVGRMTDRPAMYALARYFGWNPANVAN